MQEEIAAASKAGGKQGELTSCDKYNDVATASLIEVWINQTERRTWFLSEIVQGLGRALSEPMRQAFEKRTP